MLAGEAHIVASVKTEIKFKDQHPDSVIPRVMSERQLVISVSP